MRLNAPVYYIVVEAWLSIAIWLIHRLDSRESSLEYSRRNIAGVDVELEEFIPENLSNGRRLIFIHLSVMYASFLTL